MEQPQDALFPPVQDRHQRQRAAAAFPTSDRGAHWRRGPTDGGVRQPRPVLPGMQQPGVRVPGQEENRSATWAASSRRNEVRLQSLRPLMAGECAGEGGGVGFCLPRLQPVMLQEDDPTALPRISSCSGMRERLGVAPATRNSMLTSLDVYTEDEHGRFGRGAPEDEAGLRSR